MAKKIIPGELAATQQVEALLFSSGKTMSEEQLATLTGLAPLAVRNALITLQKEYDARETAISIFNDPTGWKMMVRDKYVHVVKNIVADTELSRACMETLAIIAYKYPKVLQSEVIDIRGGGAYEHMAELERLGFIAREPSGRSYSVKLTEKFFNYFDVAGGKDIREVFKNVKVPKRIVLEGQKTLGDLPIIDVAKIHHDPAKLDGMKIVDVPPPEERPVQEETTQADDDAAPEGDQSTAPEEQGNTFLDDLDKRIARLTERNDDLDKDDAFKRKPLPGMEEVGQEKADEPEEQEEKKKE